MKTAPPRRSKSLSRQERNLSVTHVTPVLNDFQTSAAQARASSESANSNSHQVPGTTSALPSGASLDKNKNKKVFGRLSGDREGSQSGGSDSGAHKRSGSALSDAQRRAISPYEEPIYGPEYVCRIIEVCYQLLISTFHFRTKWRHKNLMTWYARMAR